jgi:hypothetical protein
MEASAACATSESDESFQSTHSEGSGTDDDKKRTCCQPDDLEMVLDTCDRPGSFKNSHSKASGVDKSKTGSGRQPKDLETGLNGTDTDENSDYTHSKVSGCVDGKISNHALVLIAPQGLGITFWNLIYI